MPGGSWKKMMMDVGKWTAMAVLFMLGLFFCIQIAAVIILWMAA